VKIIDTDPAIHIPNIMESDVRDKIFVIRLESCHHECKEYIGYIFKESDKLYCYGGLNTLEGKCVSWYSNFKNLINLLIHIWKSTYDNSVYILESKEDFSKISLLIYNPEVRNRIELKVNSTFRGDTS